MSGAVSMHSLPEGYRALVIGASGAIGQAFVKHLKADARCAGVCEGVRQPVSEGQVRVDFEDPASLDAAMAVWRQPGQGPFHLLIDATGVLSLGGATPEKRMADLDAVALARYFQVNAIGPALWLARVAELLPTGQRCVVGTLSARVGSIGDNRKGGWYGYRASKAALNMLWRTAAVEVARRRPEAVMLCLHPGTVVSGLSAPFAPGGSTPADWFTPDDSAARLLAVMDGARGSGEFLAYDGTPVPW